ncbi:hypothetical protein [Spirosoma litoris]
MEQTEDLRYTTQNEFKMGALWYKVKKRDPDTGRILQVVQLGYLPETSENLATLPPPTLLKKGEKRFPDIIERLPNGAIYSERYFDQSTGKEIGNLLADPVYIPKPGQSKNWLLRFWAWLHE